MGSVRHLRMFAIKEKTTKESSQKSMLLPSSAYFMVIIHTIKTALKTTINLHCHVTAVKVYLKSFTTIGFDVAAPALHSFLKLCCLPVIKVYLVSSKFYITTAVQKLQ